MLGASRDQAFLRSYGSPPPVTRPDAGESALWTGATIPYEEKVVAAHGQTPSINYIGINPSIAKSYVINPTNQGQRAAIASRQSMMYDPRDNPSRSQMSEGYTDPAQVFVVTNTWQTPSGLSSKGDRARQPSTKEVSPFARLPIPTRMPWDL